jgi:DNA-binding transcriptional MerR regulator
LLGVTTESLRNYQRLGIIEPKADGRSIYNCFDPISVGRLLAMRKLQTAGCRLADVSRSMKEYSLQEYMHIIDANVQDARQRLEYQKCLIERMESHLAFAESFADGEAAAGAPGRARDRIQVAMSPALYCLDYLIGDTIAIDDSRVDQFVQWTQHMLFVLNYSPCDLEGLSSGHDPIKIGLAVDKKYVGLLDLDVASPAYLRPPRLSVTCPIQHLLNGKAFGDTAQRLSEFMKDEHLAPAEGAYYVNEISFHRHSQENFFSRLYIPVR